MKAIVIEAPGDIAFRNIDDPVPGPNDVVVHVAACGICGTDLHLAAGESPLGRYPLVPGHEFAGQVVAKGKAVTRVTLGSRVAVDPSLYCGTCPTCRLGRSNLCECYNALGVTRPGGAAEYAVAPAANVRELPDGFDLSLGALIEPLSCAVHGFDMIGPRVADRVLIYGAGTMGLMLLLLAQRFGALSVHFVEPNPGRREHAVVMGASGAVANASELNRPEGFEIVIDASGVTTAIQDGINRVRRGGTFLQFGVAAQNATVGFSPYRIYNDEVRIIGSMAVFQSFDRACQIASEWDLGLGRVVSHRLPLAQYASALDQLHRGDGYKVQVLPGLDGKRPH